MKAMILAAGVGSRLRPLTDHVPKPMLPIAGEPLLAHTIRWLQRSGITEIGLNLYHLPDVVRDGLGDGSSAGVRLHYLHETTLSGTAGAVRQLRGLFDERFVVVYGDLLVDIDLAALERLHLARQAAVTLGLKLTDDFRSQGMVELGQAGQIVRFAEKPAVWPAEQRTANAGIYLVEPAVVDMIPADVPSDWGHDVFPALLAAGQPLYGAPVDGFLLDIGTHAAYAQVRAAGIPPRS
jgi:NDP-sugar pyrophosphorylase family protein